MINVGPTVACIDGQSLNKVDFKSPIYEGPCEKECNHMVLLVGWTENHWVFRNSFGEEWSNNGFAYLPRTQPNMCGVNTLTGAVRAE